MATALAPLTQQILAASEDLPVHPLVVHAAVVVLPLSLLGLIVAVVLPRLRPHLAGLSVLGLAGGAVAAWAAEQSGESLAERVGEPQAHAQYGELVPVAAVVALIVAAIWWRLQRGPAVGNLPSWSTRAAGLVAVATAVVTTGLTILTGHSGAVAVWAAKGQATATVQGAATPTPAAGGDSTGTPSGGDSTGTPSGGGTSGYAMTEVAKHNTRTDCWSVVDGKVYNLSAWISEHPGGQAVVLGMCGGDATAAFRGKHATAPGPVGALAKFALGPLSAGGPAGTLPTTAAGTAAAGTAAARTAVPVPTTRYARAELAKHDRMADCWSVVNGKVYDLTKWVSRHPGGQKAISEMCGTNGAGEFLEQHTGDAAANEVLAGYQIGVLA
jgi:cytochrome b involved in lipid metabolism/branched-subunit amino acid transport protein